MDDKNQNNLQNEQSTAPVKTEKKCPCRGRLRRVLVLLLAVVLIASAFMLVRYFVQTRTMQESNDSAASLANAVIPSLLKPKPEGTDAETTEPREEGAVPGTNAHAFPCH